MRKVSAFGWMVVATAALGAASSGCSEEAQAPLCAQKVLTSEASCAVSADCTAAGLDLSCIDGTCRLACRSDLDCDLVANADPNDDPECRADEDLNPGICQSGVCEVGCPDVPCAAGETCAAGRCAVYAEGFELEEGVSAIDLAFLGFNDPPGELPNTRTKIVMSGFEGCTPDLLRCVGPAAEGTQFVLMESEPTPPKGQPISGTTCRACACCLECLAEPPSMPASLASCPVTPNVPTPLSCPVSHPSCNAVCAACDQCPAADRPDVATNRLLVSCEKTAAAKSCALCEPCDAFLAVCQDQQCPECTISPTSAACRNCVDMNCLSDQRCRDCLTCADAQNCARTDRGSAECNRLRDACDQQGAAGCFDVPVNYFRAQLSDDEQALTSPVIDLMGQGGDLVLQFDYVSFDVGLTYFPGIQGTPPDQWTQADQNVRVQLCAGACAMAASWVDGQDANGTPVLLPFAERRNNGLFVGGQSIIDWRGGQVSVTIPEAFRTSQFRFRLLPQLDDGAQLGVDNILIRRRP